MVDLNISVKVLSNKAPYLLVWWNEEGNCADGFLVTCSCQGYQLNRTNTNRTSRQLQQHLSVALKEAEIMTIHPARPARSLCREADVVTVEEVKRLRGEQITEEKKRRSKRRNGSSTKSRNGNDKKETTVHTDDLVTDGTDHEGGGLNRNQSFGDLVIDENEAYHKGKETCLEKEVTSSDELDKLSSEHTGPEQAEQVTEENKKWFKSRKRNSSKGGTDVEKETMIDTEDVVTDGIDHEGGINGDQSSGELDKLIIEQRFDLVPQKQGLTDNDQPMAGTDPSTVQSDQELLGVNQEESDQTLQFETKELSTSEIVGEKQEGSKKVEDEALTGTDDSPTNEIDTEQPGDYQSEGDHASTRATKPPADVDEDPMNFIQPDAGGQPDVCLVGRPVSEVESDPSRCDSVGNVLNEGEGLIFDTLMNVAGEDQQGIQISEDMIVTVQTVDDNGEIAVTHVIPAVKDISPGVISDAVKELFTGSLSGGNVSVPDKDPQDEEGGLAALPCQDAHVPVQDTNLKDSAEWEHLKRARNERFLEKCNKKQRRFVRFVLCHICGAALCSTTFQHHLEAQHHRAGQRKPQFTCKVCNKKFLYAQHVRRHELIHKNVRFLCQFCPKTFSQSGKCRDHEKSHTGEPLSKLAQLERKYASNPHVNPPVKCQKCNKLFKKGSLAKHMKVHDPSPGQSVTCRFCGKSYRSQSSLSQHEKVHREKEHACEVCGKAFHYKLILQTHMRIHTKERPIPCRYCGERFSRYQARLNHERRHTGETPYHCHVCVKAWRDRTTYVQHMNRHHPDEPVMTLRKPSAQLLQSEMTPDHHGMAGTPGKMLLESLVSQDGND